MFSTQSHHPDPVRHAEFYADVPTKRGLAWVVDTILIALITALIVPFTAFTALFFLPVLYATVSFLYRVVTLARSAATPGMRLMAIELRGADGARVDGGTAFVHTLFYSLSMMTVFPQLASVAMMLTSPRAQGLSDRVLGTVVINRAAR